MSCLNLRDSVSQTFNNGSDDPVFKIIDFNQ